jgi:hypothetical protein
LLPPLPGHQEEDNACSTNLADWMLLSLLSRKLSEFALTLKSILWVLVGPSIVPVNAVP